MWENVYIDGHVILVVLLILQHFATVHILRSALLGILNKQRLSKQCIYFSVHFSWTIVIKKEYVFLTQSNIKILLRIMLRFEKLSTYLTLR